MTSLSLRINIMHSCKRNCQEEPYDIMNIDKPNSRRKALLKDINTNRECITTAQAAERSGLSKIHLARLLRNGALEGLQLGRDWLIYTDSLEKYLATPHKTW